MDSLFRLSLTSCENVMDGETEGPLHDLRHILEGMEVFVVDSEGNVVGGKRSWWNTGRENLFEVFVNYLFLICR